MMETTDNIKKLKEKIRKEIADKKKSVSSDLLTQKSEEILNNLSSLSLFLKSRNILLYHSLPDEVQTASFIEKWYKEKNIFLPVVEGNDLTIKKFEPKNLIKGSFNILEPQGDPINDLAIIDLAIIPGVAFDRKCNRLGRGKGFYDRLLKNLKCKKIGIAFTFQIIDSVPVDEFDVPLDGIVSEKEIII